MLKNQPTVLEVNKYIEPVVSALLSEFNKVTHPDFDKALREKTGIGWKQVKNYRNHTDPTSVIPMNSKVIKFVFRSRKEDKFYRLKRRLINLSALSMISAIIGMIFISLRTDRRAYERKLDLLIEKRMEEAMGAIGLKGCLRQSKDLIRCPGGDFYLKSNDLDDD